jgi:hypothetical protein
VTKKVVGLCAFSCAASLTKTCVNIALYVVDRLADLYISAGDVNSTRKPSAPRNVRSNASLRLAAKRSTGLRWKAQIEQKRDRSRC